MSKFMAALMAFFMMILSWLGININKPDVPVTEPDTSQVITTEPETEPVTEPETEPITEPETEPDDGTVRKNAYKTDIALHCNYIKDRKPHESYPDSFSAELTDGLYSYFDYASYSNAAFSGYMRLWESSLKIDVELNETNDRIYEFTLSYLATDDAGINIPEAVAIYISNDGESWSKLGNADIPPMQKTSVQSATLTLDKYVSAKYVRFSVYNDAAFVFLDEVIVTADVKPAENTSFSDAVSNAYDCYGAVPAPASPVPADRTLTKTSVSEGKTYTVSGAVQSPFTDDGLKLTNGISGSKYESGEYAGLICNEANKVTIDFGETISDIAGIEVSAYSRIPSGIYLPAALNFTAIDEEGNRTPLGTRYPTAKTEVGTYVFSLEFDNVISAKQIEAEFAQTPCSSAVLTDEINVFAYRQTDTFEACYPAVHISHENFGEWSVSADDYDTYQNLLLNINPQIVAQGRFTEEQDERNTKADSGLMTDGIHSGSTNIYNGKYQIFYVGKTRQIIFDLQKLSSLDKFTCEFTNQTSWAVHAPENVKVYLSENGTDWYLAGNAAIDISQDPAVVTGTLELSSAVKARYICYEFAINIFAGCSELEAYGTKNTQDGVSLTDSGFDTVNLYTSDRFEPTQSFLNASRDTCLLYHSKSFGYTPEQLIPYLSYIDTEGNITDTMFDSFLFLMSGNFPSGAASYSDSKLSDWKWCIDDLFTDGENILALEEAAGTVKEALNLPDDYVFPFTVAVYCPNVLRTNFGDIDGDGIDEDFSGDADRIKALKAYADMFEQRLSEYDFNNISFSGYYWMKEEMDTANRDNVIVKAFSDYIHERGYNMFWIPYIRANGFSNWKDYGFDCAVMQPNYVFSRSDPYSRLPDCANLSELYGMGMEMEIDNSCLTTDEFYKRYMKYLSDGVKYGYMDDCVIMYYQSLLIIYDAAHSETGRGRLLYDNTYSFIKGTLDIYPDKADDQSFNCSMNTPFSSVLTLPSSMWYEVTVTSAPSSGSLMMNTDGTFTYYPEKNYTGSVEFSFTYSTSFEHSEDCKVIINVE